MKYSKGGYSMIGERLYDLRKDAGMTQQELADLLKLSKYTISSYENENTMPSDDIKVEIAKIFHVSTDYLLGLIDEPLPYERDDQDFVIVPHYLPKHAKEEILQYIDYITAKHKKKDE